MACQLGVRSTRLVSTLQGISLSSDSCFELTSSTGYKKLKKVSTSLLLTCRLAYLEGWHIPPVSKEHIFWGHAGGPPTLLYPAAFTYFSKHRWTSDHLSLVKAVHFFTTQWWLEACLAPTCRNILGPRLPCLETLTITIRRGVCCLAIFSLRSPTHRSSHRIGGLANTTLHFCSVLIQQTLSRRPLTMQNVPDR